MGTTTSFDAFEFLVMDEIHAGSLLHKGKDWRIMRQALIDKGWAECKDGKFILTRLGFMAWVQFRILPGHLSAEQVSVREALYGDKKGADIPSCDALEFHGILLYKEEEVANAFGDVHPMAFWGFEPDAEIQRLRHMPQSEPTTVSVGYMAHLWGGVK